MCKKLFYFISLVLVLSITGNAMAQLDPASITDGHVYLFENVGDDIPDDSANNHTANLIGNPQVVDGLKGKALQFNGFSDGVHILDGPMVNLSTHQNRTVVAIFKCADVTKPEKQVVYEEGGTTRGLTIYVHEGLVYTGGWNLSDYTPEWIGTYLSAPISSGVWYAVAMVVRDGGAGQEDDKFEMWMDGKLISKGPGAELRPHTDDCGIGYHNSQVKFHDGNVSSTGSYFEGIVDEIWMINAALTQVELRGFAGEVWPYAFCPTPADGAHHANTWVELSWRPGIFAVSDDIYFGDNFDDVNDGVAGTFMGNQTATSFTIGLPGGPYPEGLVLDTTYYWRIDEIEADGTTVHKGDVWSFTISVVEDFETNDFSKFSWSSYGEQSWETTRSERHSGFFSAGSGSIEDFESTTLEVSIDCVLGDIIFYRKVSSEPRHDNLKFKIDGVEKGAWSGEEDWSQVSFPVDEGTRTFEWTYSKDGSDSEGDDAAWIDDIVFPIGL
ncbi:MAG: hypothetical protein ACYTBP_12890 [Planctomycetota bacterium]|jgi:hypothetical protein